MPAKNQKFAQNPAYNERIKQWKRCRDAVAGEDAIKAGGKKYLTPLHGTSLERNIGYAHRASWYAASGQTAHGLTGLVLRKPPAIEYPDEDQLEAVGCGMEGIGVLLQQAILETLVVGRVCHLVDMSEDAKNPYIAQYDAESVINWREQILDGRRMLTVVILEEQLSVMTDHFYNEKAEKVYRVLRYGTQEEFNLAAAMRDKSLETDYQEEEMMLKSVTPSTREGRFYWQELWMYQDDPHKPGSNQLVMVRDPVVPRRVGSLWDRIPFLFTNVSDHKPEPSAPPLLGLVDVNISHFRNSADLEHGLHFTALPTVYAFGFDPNDDLVVGSTSAWVSRNTEGSVGMLEFTGAGLGTIRETMNEKKKEMAVLGSRILEDQKAGVEAAEAMRLRLTGDSNILSNVAMSVGEGFEILLEWLWSWTNASDPDISVKLNHDFNPKKLDPQQLTSLMSALQSGMISYDTFFWNLQTGEMYAPDTTQEEEKAAIEKGVPGQAESGLLLPGQAPAGALANEPPVEEPLDEPDEPGETGT